MYMLHNTAHCLDPPLPSSPTMGQGPSGTQLIASGNNVYTKRIKYFNQQMNKHFSAYALHTPLLIYLSLFTFTLSYHIQKISYF